MDIQQTYEIYKKQLDAIRKADGWDKPSVLTQFRSQFTGFNDSDIELLTAYLTDNSKKWFVADLLNALDTFSEQLLRPMLTAAADEGDPSFNRKFVEPCRRIFSYLSIQTILLDLFVTGDNTRKKGILKVYYWARPTVYERHTITLENVEPISHFTKGKEVYKWDNEMNEFEETFEADIETYNKEVTKQSQFYTVRTLRLIEEFQNSNDIDLKYHLALTLPNELADFPDEIKAQGKHYLNLKSTQGTPANIAELDKVKNIKSDFLKRIVLSFYRLFTDKRTLKLKHK